MKQIQLYSFYAALEIAQRRNCQIINEKDFISFTLGTINYLYVIDIDTAYFRREPS